MVTARRFYLYSALYSASDGEASKSALTDPLIAGIAEKYGKTGAQVVLRWHIDSGLSAIPKSVRPERIPEKLDVFDFTLTPDEIAAIDGLDTGVHGGPDQGELAFRDSGFTIPEGRVDLL